jgi:hypothetical protein
MIEPAGGGERGRAGVAEAPRDAGAGDAEGVVFVDLADRRRRVRMGDDRSPLVGEEEAGP